MGTHALCTIDIHVIFRLFNLFYILYSWFTFCKCLFIATLTFLFSTARLLLYVCHYQYRLITAIYVCHYILSYLIPELLR